MMVGFAIGVVVGALAVLVVIGAFASDLFDAPRIWRVESDCLLQGWFVWLRRHVRRVRVERCSACGHVHALSNDPPHS